MFKERHLKKSPSKKYAKVPLFMQMENLESGAASLLMVLSYFGKWLTIEQVRKNCGASRDGSNILNVVKAAEDYGLKTDLKQVKAEDLINNNTFPCIINFDSNNNFVVLCGIKRNKIIINDPRRGITKISKNTLKEHFCGECINFNLTNNFKQTEKPHSIYNFAKTRLKGSKYIFAFIILITFLTSMVNLLNPIFSRVFIDRLLSHQNIDWLYPFLLIMFAVCIVQVTAQIIQSVYILKVQGKFAIVSNTIFLWHVLHLPMEFFFQRRGGDILLRQQKNETISYTLINQFVPIAINILVLFFYLVIMLKYSILLTIIGVFSVFLNITVARITSKKRVDITRVQMRDKGNLSSMTVSGIDLIETIKSNGMENFYFRKWADCNCAINNEGVKYSNLNAYLGNIPTLVSSLTNSIILILGVYLTINNQFSIGMIVAFQSLMGYFMTPANSIITSSQTLQEMQTDIERIEDVMNYETYSNDKNIVIENYQKLTGKVSIKNLTFGYDKLKKPTIENFNLELEPGSKVALVGPSGCGKSTISKLIAGLYEPWSGEILFDGKYKSQINDRIFASSVSIVDQDIILFEDTIENNLNMWDSSISKEDIIKASCDAKIHDDIKIRKDGYNAKISENGKNFSGGQKQRLEIARALSQNPTILILDEATNALDAKTESEILEAIDKRNMACIIIAHRISTIKNCDKILVINDGKIVEQGNHDELVNLNGIYAKLLRNE